jgi:DNA-binding transcriptional ArsR family regulator
MRQESYAVLRYSAMQHIPIDEYVMDVLLPDLTGHDRAPAAFLVYIILWTALYREEQKRVALSLQELSARTGLSKSAVQNAVRVLKRRGLIKVIKTRPTAVPQYELVRHWVRRRSGQRVQPAPG